MIKQEYIFVETDEQIDDVVNMVSLINGTEFTSKNLREFLKESIPKQTCRSIALYENRHPIACVVLCAPTKLAPSVFILAAYCMPEFSNKYIQDYFIKLIDLYAMECGATSVIADTKRFEFRGWKRYGFTIKSVNIERNLYGCGR